MTSAKYHFRVNISLSTFYGFLIGLSSVISSLSMLWTSFFLFLTVTSGPEKPSKRWKAALYKKHTVTLKDFRKEGPGPESIQLLFETWRKITEKNISLTDLSRLFFITPVCERMLLFFEFRVTISSFELQFQVSSYKFRVSS